MDEKMNRARLLNRLHFKHKDVVDILVFFGGDEKVVAYFIFLICFISFFVVVNPLLVTFALLKEPDLTFKLVSYSFIGLWIAYHMKRFIDDKILLMNMFLDFMEKIKEVQESSQNLSDNELEEYVNQLMWIHNNAKSVLYMGFPDYLWNKMFRRGLQ